MFFGFDPLHMIVIFGGMAMIFGAQMWLKGVFGKYEKIRASRGMSGRDVADAILRENGLSHVTIEQTPGILSDHYDPMAKAVRLSPGVYSGNSIASVAVAAHECGHAIQHAQGYFPVVIRSAMAPAVNIGSMIGPWLIMIALMLGVTSGMMPAWAWMLAWVGVILYATAVLFHFVTLPVELDASGRALQALERRSFLGPAELPGAKHVLTAAAFTYIVAALYALMELAYWIFRLMGMRREE